MNTKGLEGIKTANEIHLHGDKEEADYVSYDAPPLDFSYKNIKNLACRFILIQNFDSFNLDKGRKVH